MNFVNVITILFLLKGVAHSDDISLLFESSFMHPNAKDFAMQEKMFKWIVSFAEDG